MTEQDNKHNITLSANSRRVILCGSLSFYHIITEIHEKLLINGIPSIPPSSPNINLSTISETEVRRLEAYKHLKRIRDPRTHSILVVNPKKHGINDYIGPSTFAEIAVAFAQSKPIYILFDYPDVFESEFTEWRATPLLGNIDNYIESVKKALKTKPSQQMEIPFS